MAIGWFIVPYKRRLNAPRPTRYCAMDDATTIIEANGGKWTETEILGDRALVKVRAPSAILETIAQQPNVRRVPLDRLNDPLSSLPNNVRNALKNEITDAGYTIQEVNASFPNLADHTLGDVLRFMASRRKKPRYDVGTDTFMLDGIDQPCRSVDEVDGEIIE